MKRIVSQEELTKVSEILDIPESFIEEVLLLRDEMEEDGDFDFSR